VHGTNPGVDLALVVSNLSGNVVLNDGGEGILITDLADPAGELRVPESVVPANQQAVLLGEADQVVTGSEVEAATAWLNGIPFHTILRCDLAEVGFDDGIILGVGECALVTNGAEVFLALGLECSIDAACACGWCGFRQERRSERSIEDRRSHGEVSNELIPDKTFGKDLKEWKGSNV
jgi:hypothetical protein